MLGDMFVSCPGWLRIANVVSIACLAQDSIPVKPEQQPTPVVSSPSQWNKSKLKNEEAFSSVNLKFHMFWFMATAFHPGFYGMTGKLPAQKQGALKREERLDLLTRASSSRRKQVGTNTASGWQKWAQVSFHWIMLWHRLSCSPPMIQYNTAMGFPQFFTESAEDLEILPVHARSNFLQNEIQVEMNLYVQ